MSAARPVAMVTGASRGIGRAIALALAAAGYDVAITARTVREGDAAAGGLPGSLESTAASAAAVGAAVLPVPLDLLDRSALVPAVDRVLAWHDRLDVLVNNAIFVSDRNDARFLDTDPDVLVNRIFGDLTAQLLLSQPALRAMVDAGGGTVVNITSGAAKWPPPAPVGEGGWALSYACAKGGFHRMASSVAVELGPAGVRCYNVQPGFVATERALALPALELVASRGKPPSVVGDVVAWLLGQPDGTVRNGSTVEVDEVATALGITW